MLLAAVEADRITTVTGALVEALICLGLIAVALAWKRQHGRRLAGLLAPAVERQVRVLDSDKIASG